MFPNSELGDLESRKSIKSIFREKMGDADGEIIVPAQEIEAWMDETLEEVDDGLQQLVSLMGDLNERTKEVLMEFQNLESLKRFFMSLNLFVVPVVLAIVLCYGANESLEGNLSGFETGFQMTLNVLMFLSGAIGLPFYLYSIWESFRLTSNITSGSKSIRFQNSDKIPNKHSIDDEYSNFLSDKSSTDVVNEFARKLTKKVSEGMRSGLTRRLNSRFLETPNGSSVGLRSLKRLPSEVPALDPLMEEKEGQNDDLTKQTRSERRGEGVWYELQVRTYEQSPDLSIKIEPTQNEKRDSALKEHEGMESKKAYFLLDSLSEEQLEQSENLSFEIPS